MVKVNKGTNLYYLKDKGIIKGTYIRNGSCSIPASEETVKQLIIKNSNLSFETSISINQDLTFNYISNAFSDENIDVFKLGITTMINLGYVLDKGGSVDSDDYKKHSDYFINEAFEKFAPISPYHTEDMLCAFADLAKEMKVEMFDREQYHLIREKQQELLKSKEEGRTI